MTANAESKYQMLLQVAAGTRRRAETAALNITYTASVAAVESNTPKANQRSTRTAIQPPRKRDSLPALETVRDRLSMIRDFPSCRMSDSEVAEGGDIH
jgi:hypothetical protein